MNRTWKENWEQSKRHYLDWWNGKGLVISMWEHLAKDGPPHEDVTPPAPAKDWNQFWFDPQWRAQNLHYQLSRSSLKADIPPVANTHLGPGSLSAILGANLEGAEETIWIKHNPNIGDAIRLDEQNPWWKLHLDLLAACKQLSQDRYFVGCPDLVEGLDTLIGLKGAETILIDMALRPEVLEQQLKQINDIYFEVFDRIYDLIQVDGEMAFCYFSLWGPGKVSKLQCDVSVMISEADFRRFALPFLRQQCERIDYTLYHLDGVDAIRHLDAVLEIEELNAVQWTPGAGQPQGGDPCWYDLYRRIRDAGKSVMPCWVELDELYPLLDNVGPEGLNILMHFRSESDIDKAWAMTDKYR
ncbi:MAG: hypothetical protein JW993_19105 [Sedimentisphaerales bacterium]|nr:hypothetical protein [Sedimentisphaerales bacterium]